MTILYKQKIKLRYKELIYIIITEILLFFIKKVILNKNGGIYIQIGLIIFNIILFHFFQSYLLIQLNLGIFS